MRRRGETAGIGRERELIHWKVVEGKSKREETEDQHKANLQDDKDDNARLCLELECKLLGIPVPEDEPEQEEEKNSMLSEEY